MTDDTPRENPGGNGIASVREAIGDELMRAVRAHEAAPWFRRRRSLALATCVVVIAVPGGIAAAGLLPDEPEPFSQPAPPPLFTTEAFDSCPESVQEQIADLGSLSEYPSTPGYPVEGCPTVEDLEEAGFDGREPALASPHSSGQGCARTMEQLSAEACRELAPSGN